MATLSLSLLGPFQGKLDERPLTKFHSNKIKALLICLVVESAASPELFPLHKALLDLLWLGIALKSIYATPFTNRTWSCLKSQLKP